MTRCGRCCLHYAMKIVNLIMNFLGIAIIVYSLWLQKMWNDGSAELPSYPSLPTPWFIYTCLGVGIAVCLSSLFSYMVSNFISKSVLCIVSFATNLKLSFITLPSLTGRTRLDSECFFHVYSTCSLLSLQVAVIVTIFFKHHWSSLISKYIDDSHEDFKSFFIFHEKMCKLIALLILVPQVSVIALAIILWTVGVERMTQNRHLEIPDFTRSFLVGTGSGFFNNTTLICVRCEVLRTGDQRQNLLS